MIGATDGLITLDMMLPTEMGWALAVIFGVIVAIMSGAVAIEQGSFAVRPPATHPPTRRD